MPKLPKAGTVIFWLLRPELPGINIVSASQPAAHKKAMMRRVQTSDMDLRASSHWPFVNHLAFLGVNDLANAPTIHDISHTHVQSLTGRLEYDTLG